MQDTISACSIKDHLMLKICAQIDGKRKKTNWVLKDFEASATVEQGEVNHALVFILKKFEKKIDCRGSLELVNKCQLVATEADEVKSQQQHNCRGDQIWVTECIGGDS